MNTKFICILCGSNTSSLIKRGLRDDDSFDVVECSQCGHVQLSHLPSLAEEKMFYDQDKLVRNLIPESEMDDTTAQEKNRIWVMRQVNRVLPLIKGYQKTLDVGAGYGLFMEEIQSRGHNIEGIEVSEKRLQDIVSRKCGKVYNLDLIQQEIPESMKNNYDIVTSFHVLEHVTNPHLFMSRIHEMLVPDGLLIMELPNFNDQMKQWCSAYSDFSYLRPHISYFKAELLENVLVKAGFIDIKIRSIQNYSMENALNWFRNGVPFKERLQFDVPEPLQWLNDIYLNKRQEDMGAEALWVEAKKPI